MFHPTWWAHVNTRSLLSIFRTKMWAFHDTEMEMTLVIPKLSVPMAGFGLVDTIVNRANGKRPRLPPLPFPSSVFLFIHPSRNIPVIPVACHGSFEFSHRKPPKSDREERCLY